MGEERSHHAPRDERGARRRVKRLEGIQAATEVRPLGSITRSVMATLGRRQLHDADAAGWHFQ